jgi:hypothetical protein
VSLDTLIQQYLRHNQAADEAVRRGDSRGTHRASSRAIETWHAIRDRGESGIDAFCALLKHPDREERVAAAAYLLEYRPERALPVLEAEEHTSLGAEMTLKRWRGRQGEKG